MGTSYDFGPPALTLDPRSPGGLHPWRGERRLSKAQLCELARLVEAEGWSIDEGADGYSVRGRGDQDADFEEFFFGAAGGWLSKPSSDDDEADAQFDLVSSICDYAGWVVFDPQVGGIWYGAHVYCGTCDARIESGAYACAQGHPAAEGRVEITVSAPADIPDEPQPEVSVPETTAFRWFHHPDGRRWAIRLDGRNVELVIILPDGERIPRTRPCRDPAAARDDVAERIAKQQGNGFVEDPL